jgi:hypothetical protein
MSSSIIESLRFATQEINVYFGLVVFITGFFGNSVNIIVFTTLKTFRQTTCAFYLTTTSMANTGQALTVLIRVLSSSYFDSLSAPLSCKFRSFLSQYCALLSLTSLCMATIDQFLSMTTYRHWNNLRLARCHIAVASVFWFIHGIFTFVYYDSSHSLCVMTNIIFAKYYTYVYLLVLLGFLPMTITSTFSLLAFFEIRKVVNRQINIVHLSRDRQLTAMTLVHVLFFIVTTIPFVIFFMYTLNITAQSLEETSRNQLIYAVITILAYGGYAVSYEH